MKIYGILIANTGKCEWLSFFKTEATARKSWENLPSKHQAVLFSYDLKKRKGREIEGHNRMPTWTIFFNKIVKEAKII